MPAFLTQPATVRLGAKAHLRDLIQSHHLETALHQMRVVALAAELGRHLRLTQGDLDDLGAAAALHDQGRIVVPTVTLDLVEPLNHDQWTLIRLHPVVGARLLRGTMPDRAVAAVLHHHERWDGAGYPDGLAGTNIPLLARIIAVADAYDAMTSCRPYRATLPPDEALRQILAHAGSQFDPSVADAFVAMMATPAKANGVIEGVTGEPVVLGAFSLNPNL